MARTKIKKKDPTTQQGKIGRLLRRWKQLQKKEKKGKVKSIFIRTKTDFYNAMALVKPYGNKNKRRKVIMASQSGRNAPRTLSRLADFKDGAKIYLANGDFVVVDKKTKTFAKICSEITSKNEASTSEN